MTVRSKTGFLSGGFVTTSPVDRLFVYPLVIRRVQDISETESYEDSKSQITFNRLLMTYKKMVKFDHLNLSYVENLIYVLSDQKCIFFFL